MTIDFSAFWLVKIYCLWGDKHWSVTIAFCYFVFFLYSNKFEENFFKVVLIIICKHLEIYTKTISRLRFGDYKPIFSSPSAQRI